MSHDIDEIRDALRAFIRDQLLRDEALPGDDDDLFGHGVLDSLGLFTLVLFLNKSYSVSFKMSELRLETFNTINVIAARVAEKLRGKP